MSWGAVGPTILQGAHSNNGKLPSREYTSPKPQDMVDFPHSFGCEKQSVLQGDRVLTGHLLLSAQKEGASAPSQL
eukprot:2844105-Amphidinium_carterae.2